MAGILDASDPVQQGLLQAAFSLMSSSGPSRMPVSFGQALGNAGQAGIQGYDSGQQAALRAIQIKKAAADAALTEKLTSGAGGGILGGMNDPDLMEAVGTKLALAGHPGGAALVNAAERARAKRAAASTFSTMKSGVAPDPQETEQAADLGTPAPATPSQGLFSGLMQSPYVGKEAGLLQSQLNSAKDANPESWMRHYERLSASHNSSQQRADAALERNLNLPKSMVIVQDKASPTGWSHRDTRTGEVIAGAPPPNTSGSAAGEVIPAQHKDLHGDDYLATLPTGMSSLVKKIAAGEVDPSKASSMRYGNREAIMQRVLQYDPGYTAGRTKAFASFTNPDGKIGSNIRSLNMSISHLGTFNDLFQALNNGNLMVANAAKNRLAAELGKPEINNIKLTQQAVGEELMRVFREVNASESEAKAFADRLSPNLSPSGAIGAVQTAGKLLTGRLDSINGSWKRSANTDMDFPRLIDEKTAVALKKMGVSMGDAPAKGDEAPAPSAARKATHRYNPATGRLEAIGG